MIYTLEQTTLGLDYNDMIKYTRTIEINKEVNNG